MAFLMTFFLPAAGFAGGSQTSGSL